MVTAGSLLCSKRRAARVEDGDKTAPKSGRQTLRSETKYSKRYTSSR